MQLAGGSAARDLRAMLARQGYWGCGWGWGQPQSYYLRVRGGTGVLEQGESLGAQVGEQNLLQRLLSQGARRSKRGCYWLYSLGYCLGGISYPPLVLILLVLAMPMPSIFRCTSAMTIWSFLFSSRSRSISYSSSSSRKAVSTSAYLFRTRFSSSSRLNTLLYFSISEANYSFILTMMLFFYSSYYFRCAIYSERCCAEAELEPLSELFSVLMRKARLWVVLFSSSFSNLGARYCRFSSMEMCPSFSRIATFSSSFSLCSSLSNLGYSSSSSCPPCRSSCASCRSCSSQRPLAAGRQYICCTRYFTASLRCSVSTDPSSTCLISPWNSPTRAAAPLMRLPMTKASSLSRHLTQLSMARMPASAVWMLVFFSTVSRRFCYSSERSLQISMLRHLERYPSWRVTITLEILRSTSSLLSWSCRAYLGPERNWLEWLSSILIFSPMGLMFRKLIQN